MRWYNRMLLGGCCFIATAAYAIGAKPVPEFSPDFLLAVPSGFLEPERLNLIDFAFETASLIPLAPHIKDRARIQEAIVLACLELDQPDRALRYALQIPNWRKGYTLAALSTYCAHLGYRDEARRLSGVALKIAEETSEWRRDRIRVQVAKTLTLLGDRQQAGKLQEGVDPSEMGRVSQVDVVSATDVAFDVQFGALQVQLNHAHFDLARNTLDALVELYRVHVGNADHRQRIVQQIEGGWTLMPISIRIDLLLRLTDHALEAGLTSTATRFAGEAQILYDEHEWPFEYQVPFVARLAERWFLAGHTDKAHSMADAILEAYTSNREQIVNIYRAGSLRPLAEAYLAMDRRDRAEAVYQRAVQEGIVNPNSRPRAEDLALTCVSMVLHGFVPDESFMDQMQYIQHQLDHPW